MHTNLQKRVIMLQIIGAGAIGCLNAAHLLRIGQKVCLITRKKQSCGQLLFTTSANVQLRFKIQTSDKLINHLAPIIVCVKAPQVITALKQHQQSIAHKQIIILMHNGMGCAEMVEKLFPKNPIVCATTANAALLNAPFDITQTGHGNTYFGPFNQRANNLETLIIPFEKALGNCYWQQNINERLWLKLLINIAINPLTAIHQINNSALVSSEFSTVIRSILKECLLVSAKEGIHFDEDDILSIVNRTIQATANNYSSMNRDIFFSRQTENEFINGYLLKKAAKYNIQLPLVREFYNKIMMLEDHLQAQ